MHRTLQGITVHSFQSYTKSSYNISLKIAGHHGTDADYHRYGVQSEFCLIMPTTEARALANTILELCTDSDQKEAEEKAADAQAETDTFRAQGGVGR